MKKLFSPRSKIVSYVVFGMVLVAVARANAEVIYVNRQASGPETGQSWTNAFRSLVSALAVADYGDEIWVSEGTYKPTTTDRNASFRLKAGVKLYGGFKADETRANQRNWRVYKTILSGDLNGDDGSLTNFGENCYHVVIGANEASLDGFIIRGGNAQGKDPQHNGGGLFNDSVNNLKVVNCTFVFNRCDNAGGAISNRRSSPELTDCVFMHNAAHFGGALFNDDHSSPVIKNCVFASNHAEGIWPTGASGGAINNTGYSTPSFTNCTFSRNNAGRGGSFSNYFGSSPIILRNCILWGNSATVGKEFYNSGGGWLEIDSCDIQGGFASYQSEGGGTGGIHVDSTLIDTDPLFIDAFYGDYRLKAGSPCIDRGNSQWAPAADLLGTSRPQGNGDDMGAYEYLKSSGIIYVDADAQGVNTGTSWQDAFNRLQNGLEVAGEGDEIWVAGGIYKPSRDGSFLTTFQLKSGIGVYGGFAGYEATREAHDWTTNPTILSGDVSGEYVGYIVMGAKNAVLDGFTIRGDTGRTGGIFNMGVIGLSVNNCVFTHNFAHQGAAMYNEYATVTATGCVFDDNWSEWGGAILNYEGTDVKFINCVFRGNAANRYGGAICSWIGASVELTNCTLYGNTAGPGEGGGGAIASGNGSWVLLRNCILWGNRSANGDEVWNSDNSTVVVDHINIEGGLASISGGSIDDRGSCINADPHFENRDHAVGADGIFATEDDGFRLNEGSPCIDSGTTEGAPGTDILDVTRPQGFRIDLGAYESPYHGVICVEFLHRTVCLRRALVGRILIALAAAVFIIVGTRYFRRLRKKRGQRRG